MIDVTYHVFSIDPLDFLFSDPVVERDLARV